MVIASTRTRLCKLDVKADPCYISQLHVKCIKELSSTMRCARATLMASKRTYNDRQHECMMAIKDMPGWHWLKGMQVFGEIRAITIRSPCFVDAE